MHFTGSRYQETYFVSAKCVTSQAGSYTLQAHVEDAE